VDRQTQSKRHRLRREVVQRIRHGEGHAALIEHYGQYLAVLQELGGQAVLGERQGGVVLAGDQRQVDLHADRHEEQPQQQSLERPDVRLDLVAVFGFREQQPGKKGAQRHGNAGLGHQPAGTQHHQQSDGDEEFLQPRGGDDPVERAQHAPADQHRSGDHGDGLHRSDRHGTEERGLRSAQQRQQRQQRHDGEILEQQHREGDAAVAGDHLATLDQHLDDEGGRREGEPAADDDSRLDGLSDREDGTADQQRGEEHLHRTQPEDVVPHELQALDGEFQADGEQQEDDAEVGQQQHAVRVFDQAQRVRAEQQPGGQIAEHGAGLEPAEQRHDADRRDEEDEDLFKMGRAVHGVRPQCRPCRRWSRQSRSRA